MTTNIHVLAWPNLDERIVASHRSVMEKFDLEVGYCRDQVRHGEWMNHVMAESRADVVGFFDADCVPTNRAVVDYAISYCANFESFIGIAQVSNHIGLRSHIFAGPAFLFIWRKVWEQLGKPTFSEVSWPIPADVAEHFSYAAEFKLKRYKTLYPTHWEREPTTGVWHLHTYGIYGIGTHFEKGVYHLYEGRSEANIDLFERRCREIVEGTFSTSGMKSSRDEYDGTIAP